MGAGGEVRRSLCVLEHILKFGVWNCMRDEGGPLGAGDQEPVSNRHKLLS
ncbi:hypothetical protein Y046_6306 [Burkholderia pseudomallei MSHR2990]|nr:hypothetical protein Y046_6306 [Burkholderia pseudomallei MSHR2990]